MHAIRLSALSLALAFCTATYGQQAFDKRYKIVLSINGAVVKGSQEMAALASGLPNPGSVYDANPPMPLSPGQTFQAVVSVTDPAGTTADYTRSPRLKYDTFCMTASTLGMVTATPVTGERCDGPEYPELWIELVDASGNLISFNRYWFQVLGATRGRIPGDQPGDPAPPTQ